MPSSNAYHREYQRRRRAAARAEGLCGVCATRETVRDLATCYECSWWGRVDRKNDTDRKEDRDK